jgi:glycosyltransferase involved in cell wall biosynthesis
MQDYGLVSIITPSYNCASFVAETIESIISQTYTNWELLITDDCSTDNSCEIIKQYVQQDSRISFFQLEKNSGAGVARNLSIKNAKGRFIAFCDSDDLWMPTKLEKQVACLKSTGASICYSSYLTCDMDSCTTGIVVAYKEITFRNICRDDSIGFLTCMYNAEAIGRTYMPTIRKRQDWGLKILLLQKARKAVGIIEPLAIYRLRSNSLSNNKFSLVKYNIAIYKEVLHYSAVHAWCKFLLDFMPHYIAKRIRLRIINS